MMITKPINDVFVLQSCSLVLFIQKFRKQHKKGNFNGTSNEGRATFFLQVRYIGLGAKMVPVEEGR